MNNYSFWLGVANNENLEYFRCEICYEKTHFEDESGACGSCEEIFCCTCLDDNGAHCVICKKNHICERCVTFHEHQGCEDSDCEECEEEDDEVVTIICKRCCIDNAGHHLLVNKTCTNKKKKNKQSQEERALKSAEQQVQKHKSEIQTVQNVIKSSYKKLRQLKAGLASAEERMAAAKQNEQRAISSTTSTSSSSSSSHPASKKQRLTEPAAA